MVQSPERQKRAGFSVEGENSIQIFPQTPPSECYKNHPSPPKMQSRNPQQIKLLTPNTMNLICLPFPANPKPITNDPFSTQETTQETNYPKLLPKQEISFSQQFFKPIKTDTIYNTKAPPYHDILADLPNPPEHTPSNNTKAFNSQESPATTTTTPEHKPRRRLIKQHSSLPPGFSLPQPKSNEIQATKPLTPKLLSPQMLPVSPINLPTTNIPLLTPQMLARDSDSTPITDNTFLPNESFTHLSISNTSLPLTQSRSSSSTLLPPNNYEKNTFVKKPSKMFKLGTYLIHEATRFSSYLKSKTKSRSHQDPTTSNLNRASAQIHAMPIGQHSKQG